MFWKPDTVTRLLLPAFARCAVVLLPACGGPLAFVDQKPIAIVGDPPPPPPAPPPPKPEPKPERVTVKQDRIEIKEKIMFDVDKATIKPESHGLLDEIAAVVQKNQQLKKISIEGHTDSDGSDQYNQKLSDQRAGAVKAYLVEHGVAEPRLASIGYGESRPIADNGTADGKEKNRRVEFLIKEQDEVTKVYEVDPKTGERREVKSDESQDSTRVSKEKAR
jgi:outer membrane protein OmpA-like peptidoglycan-associated protein